MSDMSGNSELDTTEKPGKVVGGLIGLRDWVDARLPIVNAWKKHLSEYYAPKNFNFFYYIICTNRRCFSFLVRKINFR